MKTKLNSNLINKIKENKLIKTPLKSNLIEN